MKLLVTGGAGFIGSHLCEQLVARGHRVVALDDLSTGAEANVGPLRGLDAFELVVGDVCDEDLVRECAADADRIVHLAAAVGVELILQRPVRTIETNVHGTESVLAAAAWTGAPLLLASTSEVYGKSTALPFREDGDLVLGPTSGTRWAYACSKAIDEFLALAHARQSGLPVTVCRFFNTVGPRQSGRYGMVVPRFVDLALRGEPLPIHGDGLQTRCFAHVRDVVEAVVRLLDAPPERVAAAGHVFNVGTGEEVTIRALAELVRETVGSESPLATLPYEEVFGPDFEDTPRRVPDTTRLAATIGFVPRTPLAETVADVAADLRARARSGGR